MAIPIKGTVQSLFAHHHRQEDPNGAFYVVDLGEVTRQYEKWNKNLPRAKPFYAVKCNNDDSIVQHLVDMGSSFDCASTAEMEQCLSKGVAPDDIIYANPCKQRSHIEYAARHGVKKMTFDNEPELRKIHEIYPEAECVLRVSVDSSLALCNLGLKFGASLTNAPALMATARSLGLNVTGISFHVGSGCFDVRAYSNAVKVAKEAFEIGAQHGFKFSLLDLGGGFPGHPNDALRFEDVAAEVNSALDTYFNPQEFPDLQIIGEPGRYMVAASHTLAVNIFAKRPVETPEGKKMMYYVNDGVYGSFNCLIFDHATVTPQVLARGGKLAFAEESSVPCSIWGPTCDSMDCISKETKTLPELSVGDWLYFENMGAYTLAAASTFNGIPKPRCYYVDNVAQESIHDVIQSTQEGVKVKSVARGAAF